MKKRNILFNLVLFSLIFNLSCPLFSQEQGPKNEQKDEVPQFMQDIRRFEIISLGALPFVILDANLVYSGIKYFQNDMSKDYFPSFSPAMSKEEQEKILLTSMGISLGIGLTDLIVNIVKRSTKNRKRKQVDQPIHITPISENPNATKLPSREEMNNKIKSEAAEIEEPSELEVIEIPEDEN